MVRQLCIDVKFENESDISKVIESIVNAIEKTGNSVLTPHEFINSCDMTEYYKR